MQALLKSVLERVGIMPPVTRQGGRTLPHEGRAQLLLRYVVLRRALKGVSKKFRTAELPDEILFKIYTYAGFVATVEVSTNQRLRGGNFQDDVYLRLATPARAFRLFTPVNVSFEIISWDQGWTSEPGPTGERDSFSWGEAAVLPHVLSPPPQPLGEGNSQRFFIYRNRRACAAPEQQTATFTEGTALVHALAKSAARATAEGGDAGEIVVELHLRSAYPGWANNAQMGRISVDWALSDAVLLAKDVDKLWARPPAFVTATAASQLHP